MIDVTDDAMPYWARQAYNLGLNIVMQEKQAAEAQPAYAMSGMFYVREKTGKPWGLLSVPNALVRGVFSGMHEHGIELPLSEGALNAHITVMRPDEIEAIGGPEALMNDRGKTFKYTIGRLVVLEPEGWKDMSKAWMLQCYSDELQKLRRSYGLSSIPNDGRFPFHITCAVLRKGVLGRNDKSKDTVAA